MDRFIGLDVHAQTCTLTVMSASGKRLRESVVETNAGALTESVKSIAGRRHLCMEEGTHSEWLYELLAAHVERIVVTHPTKSEGKKSDSIDAWALADAIRIGKIDRPVFKAPGKYSALRNAVKAHVVTTRDVVRVKSRIKAIYRSRGVGDLGTEIYDRDQRADWLKKLPTHRRKLAELLSRELDAVVAMQEQAESWLLEEACHSAEVRRLTTVPGIATIRAAQIVGIVLTPERFRTRQQFWSYCGLGIVTRSSSDWVNDRAAGWTRKNVAQTRGLNRNRHPLLKAVFKGAAMTIITRMPKHPLGLDYRRMIDSGIKPNLARVTLARKVASAVLAIWKKKEDYDPAKHRRPTAA